jgi:hypothetical protein
MSGSNSKSLVGHLGIVATIDQVLWAAPFSLEARLSARLRD